MQIIYYLYDNIFIIHGHPLHIIIIKNYYYSSIFIVLYNTFVEYNYKENSLGYIT